MVASSGRQRWVVLAASIALAACGNSPFTGRTSNPVIVDYQTGDWTSLGPFRYGIISTTAGRRSIFIDYNRRTSNKQPRVCAEPPPDAIDALASALSASASGQSQVGATGKLEVARTMASSSTLGLYRSQGLQMLRDQTFLLCIMLEQEQITLDQWEAYYRDIRREAFEWLKAEIPVMRASRAMPPAGAVAPSLSAPKAGVQAAPTGTGGSAAATPAK